MRALIVTPAAPGSSTGNRVTAERWARRLTELGHDARVLTTWDGEPADLLVALHARKSHSSVVRFSERFPRAPLIVGLVGTDIHLDIDRPEVHESLTRARRLVALQSLAIGRIPPPLRERVRVIHQSAEPPVERPDCRTDVFEVCLLAHLRPVKDPLLAARASRRLPGESRVRIRHAGESLDDDLAAAARREQAANPRYCWLGPLPPDEARRLLAASRALVLCSTSEGGANAVSEAVVCGVPVLSTRIEGSLGLLGDDYPGFFPVGDDAALAGLLSRIETSSAFLGELRRHCTDLAPLFTPDAERTAWRDLLRELTFA